MNKSELTRYLNDGVAEIAKTVLSGSLFNPREAIFLYKMKKAFDVAARKRTQAEERGLHVPAFLIASITSNCNLYCRGCYARANRICSEEKKELLPAEKWRAVFREAADLGVSFTLLAGGEPLLREDVLTAAGEIREMIFPVFTNGTLIDDAYLRLLDRHRNLVPVVSLEGGESTTDDRRGTGTYQILIDRMKAMKKRGLLFGASVTVSRQNMDEVTRSAFLTTLHDLGCKILFFIEYVPVDRSTQSMAFDDSDRLLMEQRQERLRKGYPKMLFLSFPGDEKYMGGCLAAGRGFFHINSDGSAEACPFSPYSDCNVTDGGVRAALRSDLFAKITELNSTDAGHMGGCSLFEKEDQVRELLK